MLNIILANIIWQPQLSLFRGGLLIVAVAVWLTLIYTRLVKRYSGRRLWLLFAPKAVIAVLLVLLFFDPVRTVKRNITQDLRFLVLTDNSSSMEVKDHETASRKARAESIANTLERRLPEAEFDKAFFTDHIVDNTDLPQSDGSAVRPTDLARVLLDIEQRQASGLYDGAVILTDGGDERFDPFRMPSLPIYFVAIGSEPGQYDDIEIHSAEAPDNVEPDTDFTLTVALQGYGDSSFIRNLDRLRVDLEERSGDNGKWIPVSNTTVDLRSGWTEAKMDIPGTSMEGERNFRILAQPIEGELTHLNNERYISVKVEKQRLRVLLYTRMLGRNESILRRMLVQDQGIDITSLIRLSGERFVVKSSDKENSGLPENFPDSAALLRPFQTVIIGSFPADGWSAKQMQALVEFVEQGGSAVFLGGEDSFGRGGYNETPLNALFPWNLRSDEPAPVLADLGVSVTPAVARQDLIRGWAEKMNAAHPMYIQSMNRPGRLRPGAVSLLDVLYENNKFSVIAIQPYGRGQVMGVGTDTIWRWRTAGKEAREAYDYFWSAAIRHIAGLEQGGRFLRVDFDKNTYHPGERAEIQTRVAGNYPEGRLHIQVDKVFQKEHQLLPIENLSGPQQEFRTRTLFENSGDYIFNFTLFIDNREIETYSKNIWVGSRINEGANIYVDRLFLKGLAARAGEKMIQENNQDTLVTRIKERMILRDQNQTQALVEYRGIYLILVTLILAGEWIIRRRMNLF